ncbi:MAG: L-histidine N(alpha)-methyltransferase [Deltaproteobacteria bacterium]|nr:L-histidine N(alpha)-methyltransferase [Deltaproteobacteria bacterium]
MAEVLDGLSQQQKSVSPKFFYDERGSRLFDEITRLPEYYVTSTELEILREHGAEMASYIGEGAALIELGIGSPEKARRLLDHLPDLGWYVPVDISESALDRATRELRAAYPELEIRPICTDFTRPLALAGLDDVSKRVLFYPGSTIGNLDPEAASAFLARLRHTHLQPGDGLLLGGDLQKDIAVVEAAYDDAAGVTAAFNKNLLLHLNRRFEGDFDPGRFDHVAFYNAELGRIEMHLRSRQDQVVTLGGRSFHFLEGETLHTESSYKYTTKRMQTLAGGAGYCQERFWTDRRRYFGVWYFSAC